MSDFVMCPNCFKQYSPDEIAAMLEEHGMFWCECDWQDDTPPLHRPPFLSELAKTNDGAARIYFALALLERFEPEIIKSVNDCAALWLSGPGVGLEDEEIISLARAAGVKDTSDED